MHLNIKENAIFIADAHHNSLYQNTLDSLFSELLTQEKRQIFLLGDIFDLLIGSIKYSIKDNENTLNLLEQVALKHEVYYFEGNHDFLLQKIPHFKNITYFPLEMQPVRFLMGQKECYLAHGDVFLNWHYKMYSKILRQKFFMAFLNCLSFYIYPKVISHLSQKNNKKLTNNEAKDPLKMEKFIQFRVENYLKKIALKQDSYIIEGHFHLGCAKKFKQINYIGLPFFACKKKYFVVKYENNCLILKEF